MISVLIPIYNTDVRILVNTLYQQLQAAGIVYEVILLDDKSDDRYQIQNRGLANRFISYIESPVNNGRTAIRNLLAQRATYDWLLFMDGDSLVCDTFIPNYTHQLKNRGGETDVIVGGTTYQSHPPDKCELHLHWAYGTNREKLDLKRREREPYYGFTCNNLVIRKRVFQQLSFSPFLQGYGHEDTWIGMQLEKLQVRIHYVNNPVIHNGIEPTSVYLKKTQEALKNLLLLRKVVGEETLRKHVKLYNTYYWQKKWCITPLVNLIFYILNPFIRKKLFKCRPPLRLFDLYRLYNLNQLVKVERVNNSQSQ